MNISKRVVIVVFLVALIECAPALASSITVQPQLIPGVFDPRISAASPPHLRIFCSAGFQSNDVPPVFVPQGAPSSGRYYQDIVCGYTPATGSVIVPSFTLISTADALTPANTASNTFTLYTSSGQQLAPDPVASVYYNIRVPATIVSASGCSPAGHCADWRDLLIYSRGPLSPNIDVAAYTKAEVDAKILANIASQVPITAPFVLSTSVPGLINAQVLASLATGIPKVTTGTGLLSIAAAGTDYQAPIASSAPITFSSNTVGCPTCLTGGPFASGQLVIGAGGQGLSALGSLGTVNQVYHGNAGGAGSFGPVAIGDVSGSTGTGNFVFSVSPALTTPNVGAATATSIAGLTGGVTPGSAGGTTIGTAALPFGSVFVGNGPNSSAQLSGTFSANRTVTFPDANSVTVQSSTAPANQFANGISSSGVVSYAQPAAANLSNGVTGSGPVVLQTGATINSPSLTAPNLGVATATSISGLTGALTPNAPGGTDVGSAALPFGHLWLGGTATNNYQFIGPAATGPRTVTVAADSNSVTVVAASAPANQFFNSLSAGGVLGSAQPVLNGIGSPTGNATFAFGTNSLSVTFGNISGSPSELHTLGQLSGSPSVSQVSYSDVTGNTNTGALVSINTVGSSTALPLQVTGQGTANGIKVDSSGILRAMGVGGVDAAAVVSGVLASARVPAINLAAGGNGGVTGNLPVTNLNS